ncbi:feruloyl-CoA synthase [Xanthobacter sp. AM11]|uniref:feruloyl-CoA synthase n=1 Tax=Xanthobacter sp. AM11 TaxID=3380643 RepID=UPI0039BED98C
MHAMIPSSAPLRLFGKLDPVVETRPDGVIVVRSAKPLPHYAASLVDRLEHWAKVTPERVFLAERRAGGGWRELTYGAAFEQILHIGAALLARDLSDDEPVLILSGNGIDHALLSLAGMAVGVPTCPMSTAYSLVSQDLGKLSYALDLLTPRLVFAAEGKAYARALKKVKERGVEIVVSDDSAEELGATAFASLMERPISSAVVSARTQVGPDSIAKFLLTSGSTGYPKAVTNTHRMICANQVMLAEAIAFLKDEPPVLVDWLPWAHTFGSNHNFGIALYNGGTLYIDAGKPVPNGLDATVRNLREIAPTIYFNVPKGFEALLPHLQADEALRLNFFSRLKLMMYAGAGLAKPVWDAYRDLSIETVGHPITMTTSLGATETAPGALIGVREVDRPGIVGVPHRGVELKLVPNAGKLEARLRGPNITPGYWRRPDLTQSAFDAEGFYLLGDALRLAEPNNFAAGFEFDGRVSEDFKLATGTWVSVGPLRMDFIGKLDPLVRDAVVTGHDRDDIGMLVFPEEGAVRALVPHLPGLAPLSEVLSDPAVHDAFRGRLAELASLSTGSSTRVMRVALLAEPPSIDLGESTDKGSLNQRAVLANRAGEVEILYSAEGAPNVVKL